MQMKRNFLLTALGVLLISPLITSAPDSFSLLPFKGRERMPRDLKED